MSDILLQGTGVETFYGKIQALRGIDFEVHKGEIATVIGANGAGKSTLMMTICGTPRARAGNIVFDGQIERIVLVALEPAGCAARLVVFDGGEVGLKRGGADRVIAGEADRLVFGVCALICRVRQCGRHVV